MKYAVWYEDEGENKADHYVSGSAKEAAEAHEKDSHLNNMDGSDVFVRDETGFVTRWRVDEVVSYSAVKIVAA